MTQAHDTRSKKNQESLATTQIPGTVLTLGGGTREGVCVGFSGVYRIVKRDDVPRL